METNNGIITDDVQGNENPQITVGQQRKDPNEIIAETLIEGMDGLEQNGIELDEFVAGVLVNRKRADVRMIQSAIKASNQPKQKVDELLGMTNRYILENPLFGLFRGGSDYIRKGYLNTMQNRVSLQNKFMSWTLPTMYKGYIMPIGFCRGALSTIGANPGAGKSTALGTIALEAMEQGKKVLYITYDDDVDNTLTRLGMAAVARQFYPGANDTTGVMAIDPLDAGYDMEAIERKISPQYQIESTRDRYIHMISEDMYDDDSYGTGRPGPELAIHRARKYGFWKIDQLWSSGQLRVCYPPDLPSDDPFTWMEFEDLVYGTDPDTIIMIDYIQSMDIYPGERQRERLNMLQKMVSGIKILANKSQRIFICAAQFKRPNDADQAFKSISLADFAESAEIDKRSDLAIGISQINTNGLGTQYYYRVMKNRIGQASRHYMLDALGYRYYYTRPKTEEVSVETGGKTVKKMSLVSASAESIKQMVSNVLSGKKNDADVYGLLDDSTLEPQKPEQGQEQEDGQGQPQNPAPAPASKKKSNKTL